MSHRRSWRSAFLWLVLLAGCKDRPPAAEPITEEGPPATGAAGPAARGEAPAAEPPTAPVGPVAKGASYELRLSGAKSYASAELAQFTMTLEGRGEWHVNTEFPFRAELKVPGALTLPKNALGKGDAAKFEEAGVRFDVPFTPEGAGEHRVEVDVSFAMCTPETCVPESAKVALVLPVK